MNNFKYFGIMADVARNAVLTKDTLKKLVLAMEKMGYNALEIYAEDLYKIEGEPFFGYLRGGYSKEDIKEIDAFCKEHNVELIPCIQTLAHYPALVRIPEYRKIVDCDSILLIDDENTYALLDKLFKTCAENFTSRQINIGMDEAHMVGLGRYLDIHGYTNRFELLTRHLNRVCEIARKYGFKPHMWSDMFYRLANKGEYYKPAVFTKEVLDAVPEDVGLAYWDYYRTTSERYQAMLQSHKQFNREIWFAGGAWSWVGYVPQNYHAINVSKAAMQAVRSENIENVLITMWGDNGGECSFFSLLPALYTIRQNALGNFDTDSIKKGFKETFGIDYDDFITIDLPNKTKRVLNKEIEHESPCKTLLFNDCFLGYFDNYIENSLSIDFKSCKEKIADAKTRMGEYAYIFEAIEKLCAVLEIKTDLGIRTRKLYKANDVEGLRKIISDYEETAKRLESFYNAYKTMWFTEKKGYGWEVQDARLGGLKTRITSCKDRLQDYVDGKIKEIPELNEEILDVKLEALEHPAYTTVITRGIM